MCNCPGDAGAGETGDWIRGLGEEREKGREGQEEEEMQCGRWGKETWEQLEMGRGLHSGKV